MTLRIDMRSVLLRLGRLTKDPLAVLMQRIATKERKKVEQRIKSTKETPEGDPWDPWKPRTEQSRRAKGTSARGLLYDEGLLLASVISRSGPRNAGIEVTAPYAPFLQGGTDHMTARAFMGWDDLSLAEYEMEAIAILEKKLS